MKCPVGTRIGFHPKPGTPCRAFMSGPVGTNSHATLTPPPHRPTVPSSHRPIVPSSHRPIVLSSHRPIVPSSHRSTAPPLHRSTAPLLHCSTAPPLHRSTAPPKHRSTETPKHRSTETPKHRNTETPKHRNTETPKHRLSVPTGRFIKARHGVPGLYHGRLVSQRDTLCGVGHNSGIVRELPNPAIRNQRAISRTTTFPSAPLNSTTIRSGVTCLRKNSRSSPSGGKLNFRRSSTLNSFPSNSITAVRS